MIRPNLYMADIWLSVARMLSFGHKLDASTCCVASLLNNNYYVILHEETKHNALDINLRYRPK